LVRRGELLLAGWWGYAFLAKLALVAAMLALAARHRFRLAPALPRGGAALAASIRVEAGVALLVFWAAAELVSVHPLDAGHRLAP
uniref:CopD family protein n=1 Tax=Falsiroseomonas oryzae TaxID=2766473 RepID=UPI0022EABB68